MQHGQGLVHCVSLKLSQFFKFSEMSCENSAHRLRCLAMPLAIEHMALPSNLTAFSMNVRSLVVQFKLFMLYNEFSFLNCDQICDYDIRMNLLRRQLHKCYHSHRTH